MKNQKNIKIAKPPLKFKETQDIVYEIEKHLKAPLICYWSSRKGEICQNDVYVFNEILRTIKKHQKCYIFVKSAGGDGTASLRLITLLRSYFKSLYALVPIECSSAATILVLGTDEISMGPLAYLTAVDTSLDHQLAPLDPSNRSVTISQDELQRVVKLWNNQKNANSGNPYQSLYPYIHPLIFGAIDRANSLSIKLCQEVLSFHMKDKKKIESISNALNSNFPSHNYPITFHEAKRIGIKVTQMDDFLNEKLIELNNYYSAMGQTALTDYDEFNYHDNEIINISEAKNIQIFYQIDKDWHYRKDERRWVPMNDNSSWMKNTSSNGKIISEKIFIS